jgi:dTDP-glucose 4,6-dehydratase
MRQALTGEALTVAGDGGQTRSICYVDDTISGILAMARHGIPGPVNIGSPDEITILELARTIRRLTGSGVPIRFVARPADDPAVRRPDTTLAEEHLGWRPVVSREQGLRRTMEWFVTELGVETAEPA